MAKHYIIMSSSYTDGTRVALDITGDGFLNIETIAKIIQDIKQSCGEDVPLSTHLIERPLRKFCVSDFRQKQEYHMYAVHDEACSPCLPLSREDGTVCAPLAA